MKIHDFPRDTRNRKKMSETFMGIDRNAQKVMSDAKDNRKDEGAMGSCPDSLTQKSEDQKKKAGKKKSKTADVS